MAQAKRRRVIESDDEGPSLSLEEFKKEYVSGTAIHDVFLDDCYSIWCKHFLPQSNTTPNKFLEYLFQQGKTFEQKVIDSLKQKYPNSVVSLPSEYSDENVKKTLEEMKKGTEIIHSGSLRNDTNKTYGVADLIIRSDVLSKLTNKKKLNEVPEHECKFSKDYHYIIVDIKFSTLPLRADGIYLLNQDRYKSYKGQVCLYTLALGELQGYTPTKAFILGRNYKYISRGETYKGTGCFDKLGEIDFRMIDKEYLSQTKHAIEYIQRLRQDGEDWKADLDHPELFPNMKNDSFHVPKDGDYEGEITKLWYCGVKEREKALSHGITSYLDPRFNSKIVEFKNNRAKILDTILLVNGLQVDQPLLYPQKLSKTQRFYQKKNKEFFVDFETITGVFDDFTKIPKVNSVQMIFMISAGYIEEGKWKCQTFTVNQLKGEEEFRICKEFAEFVGESELYHYSDAEINEWNAMLKRHLNFPQNLYLKDKWTDLLYLIKEEPICVRGALNFSLKTFGKALIDCGLIQTKGWESDIKGGMEAMIEAHEAYTKGGSSEDPIIKDIIKYNQYDCEMIYLIIKFIRETLID